MRSHLDSGPPPCISRRRSASSVRSVIPFSDAYEAITRALAVAGLAPADPAGAAPPRAPPRGSGPPSPPRPRGPGRSRGSGRPSGSGPPSPPRESSSSLESGPPSPPRPKRPRRSRPRRR